MATMPGQDYIRPWPKKHHMPAEMHLAHECCTFTKNQTVILYQIRMASMSYGRFSAIRKYAVSGILTSPLSGP